MDGNFRQFRMDDGWMDRHFVQFRMDGQMQILDNLEWMQILDGLTEFLENLG